GTSRWRTVVARVCLPAALVGAIGCAAATFAGFLGQLWWRFDLFAHFRVQYAVVAGACAVLLLACRRWRWALVPLAAFAVNVAAIAPLFVARAATAGEVEPVRLVAFNVHRTNDRHDAAGARHRPRRPQRHAVVTRFPRAARGRRAGELAARA